MPYQSFQFKMDPDRVAKMGDDLMRRWQETMTDAQTTASKSAECGNPMDAWSLQVEFGMRNAQRWFGWAGVNDLSAKKGNSKSAEKRTTASSPAASTPVSTPSTSKPAAVSTPEAPARAETKSATPISAAAVTAAKPPVTTPKMQSVSPSAPTPKTSAEQAPKVVPITPPVTAAPKPPVETASAPAAEAKPVAAAPASSEPDELQRIRGIGPAIATKLQAQGIRTFAQMAALDAAAIEKLDTALDLKGRIERDDWVGQAKALAAKS